MRKKLLSAILSAALVFSYVLPTEAATPQFTDMPEDYSTAALNAAVSNGLLRGSDGKILPEAELTRAELAAIVNRAFGATAMASLSAFSDLEISAWYYNDMSRAVKMKTFTGHDGRLLPESAVTRQEAFTVLARALGIKEETASALAAFSDAASVDAWAAGHVAAMVKAGFVHGAEGRLNPQDNIIRKDFAVLMDNIVKSYISTAGTVTSVAAGTVMVNVPGVTLKGVTIDGDLIIGDGVGDGNVTLDGVKVKGSTVVRGGGANSLIIKGDSTLGTITVSKVDGGIRISVEGGAKVETVYIADGKNDVYVEGRIAVLEVSAETPVVIRNAKISEINVSAPNADVTVEGGTRVENLTAAIEAKDSKLTVSKGAEIKNVTAAAENTAITGEGRLENATVTANNVKIDTAGTKTTVSGEVDGVTVGGKEAKAGETTTAGKLPSVNNTTTDYGDSGPASAPAFTGLTLTQESISEKTSAFKEAFYNKGTNGQDMSESLTDELWYFTVSANPSAAYISAVTSVSFGGEALGNSNVSVSVGNNAFVRAPLYKLDADGLKVALPIIALERPTDGKLTLTVKANGYTDAAAVISVPEMQDFACESVSAVYDDVLEVAQENGEWNVTLLKHRASNDWKHLLRFTFEGAETDENTVFFTKKVDNGRTSYGFTGAEQNGTLGFYALTRTAATEGYLYTVATADRYAALTMTLNFSANPPEGMFVATSAARLAALMADENADNVTVTASLTLDELEIPKDKTLTLPEGVTLTLSAGGTLGLNGAIAGEGSIVVPRGAKYSRWIVWKSYTISGDEEGILTLGDNAKLILSEGLCTLTSDGDADVTVNSAVSFPDSITVSPGVRFTVATEAGHPFMIKENRTLTVSEGAELAVNGPMIVNGALVNDGGQSIGEDGEMTLSGFLNAVSAGTFCGGDNEISARLSKADNGDEPGAITIVLTGSVSTGLDEVYGGFFDESRLSGKYTLVTLKNIFCEGEISIMQENAALEAFKDDADITDEAPFVKERSYVIGEDRDLSIVLIPGENIRLELTVPVSGGESTVLVLIQNELSFS